MQTLIQKQNDYLVFEKLSQVLQTAPDDMPQDFSFLASKTKDGKIAYCSLGYAGRSMGLSNNKLRYFCLGSSILRSYGFSDEARDKTRRCTEPECHVTGTLSAIIAHLNDNHKLKIKQIGKVIPHIRDDPRPTPKWHETILGTMIHIGKSFVNIANDKTSYKTS